MDLLSLEFAVEEDLLVGLGPLFIGLAVVAALIAAVWFGRRMKAREPGVPKGPQQRSGAWQTRQEYGHTTSPDHGPGHQDALGHGEAVEGHRDHSPELPRDGHRYLPHELGPYGVEEEAPGTGEVGGPAPKRPTWDRGGSGHGTG
ncbi:DUF6479 family protein [Streptomyces sp. WAC 00631]|uniref:DUF6479 family protein n=1 Tax=unclassified Streptomyces TaxID=2593676 RepID=UPI000F795EA3|nr:MULTISPECIES: DUF6479 family protein [unclassified Streptomyces]MCC5033023.1 DUF6479 family protein [Streptomyces sp. WAC 00631]MCC9741106.1 DUF6479 family protein [Streptomyces sp. MNU89]